MTAYKNSKSQKRNRRLLSYDYKTIVYWFCWSWQLSNI